MTQLSTRHAVVLGTIAILSACTSAPEPGPLAPTGNPVLSLLPVDLCAPGGPLTVTVVNTGTVDYGGGGLIKLSIGDTKNEVSLDPIPAGGTVRPQIDYPTVPGGDWTATLQLTNQQPITQSCIG